MDPNPDELEPSPLRNITGGLGCGCGCLGLLLLGVAATVLAMIPLEMFPEGPGNAGMWGVTGLCTGTVFCVLGAVGYIGSLFMD